MVRTAGQTQHGAAPAACGDPATCYSLGKVRTLLAVCAEIAICLQAVLLEVSEFAGVSV